MTFPIPRGRDALGQATWHFLALSDDLPVRTIGPHCAVPRKLGEWRQDYQHSSAPTPMGRGARVFGNYYTIGPFFEWF